MKKENEEKIKANICPKCGGKLVEREGKYGKFIGCSNFPKCRFVVSQNKKS
ncbi:MAG: topoisomerase DNA-binding C4 zinc finger domain-containing protein [Anaerococcus prevotii]|nr:topoisomerase DNA-binding C4 zinc finger domain-containing protein [Anaerococcus prevotii]